MDRSFVLCYSIVKTLLQELLVNGLMQKDDLSVQLAIYLGRDVT
jgi:hypothetical protein